MPDERLTRFPCPHCGRKLKAQPELAGSQCRCPRCAAIVTVPAAAPQTKPDIASDDQKEFATKLGIAVQDGVSTSELGALIGKARKEKPLRKSTARQREFAEELGIAFDANIGRWDLSQLIDQALEERDRKHAEEDAAAHAEEDRAEALREVLEDAEPEDMIKELGNRGQNAVLVVWETDLARQAHESEIHCTDNLTIEEAKDFLKMFGMELWSKEGPPKTTP